MRFASYSSSDLYKSYLNYFVDKEKLTNTTILAVLFLPFLPFFYPIGYFNEADFYIVVFWFLSGLLCFINPISKVSSISYGFFVLGAIAILASFHNSILSITGVSELKEGAVSFFCFAILINYKDYIINLNKKYPLFLLPLIYGLVSILGIYIWHDWGFKSYTFTDFFAFSLLASIAMYYLFRELNKEDVYIYDFIFASLFGINIYYCGNSSLLLALIIGVFYTFFVPILRKNKIMPKTYGTYLFLGLLLLNILILFSVLFYKYLPLPLQSRALLSFVTISHFFERLNFNDLFHLFFGYGFGSYQDFPVLNLFGSNYFTLYDGVQFKPNWEFLNRNLLHSHSLFVEIFNSAGIVGLSILFYMVFKLANLIKDKAYFAHISLCAFFILFSSWFHMPTNFSYTLCLFVYILSSCNEKLIKYRTISKHIIRFAGVFIISFSILEGWLSKSMMRYNFNSIDSFAHDFREFSNSNGHYYDSFGAYKISNNICMNFLDGMSQLKKSDINFKRDFKNIEQAIAEHIEFFLNSSQVKKPTSFLPLLNLCNELIFKMGEDDILSNVFKDNFYKLMLIFIRQFPQRIDIAILELNYLLNTNQLDKFIELLDCAKFLHNNPIVYWFEGLHNFRDGNYLTGKEKIKKAIELNIARYMPIPKDFITQVNQ